MENRRLTVPEYKNYEYALEQAWRLVRERLAGIDDIHRQCRNAGCLYRDENGGKTIGVRYLGKLYNITVPGADVSAAESTEEVPLREKVLIMHYFTRARGTPPSGKLITFRELPEGVVYFPTFSKRTIQPIEVNFGKKPATLIEAGKAFEGSKTDYGDTAVVIDVFSRVPVTFVLWHGDEEFEPRASIVFDSNITDYLSTEDITVVTEILTWKLVRKLREL